MRTVLARVEGRVQGVFFRDYTRRQADTLGLKGWVKNLADGSVETLLQGDNNVINKMIDWLNTGSPHSNVTKVSVQQVETDKKYSDFQITF